MIVTINHDTEFSFLITLNIWDLIPIKLSGQANKWVKSLEKENKLCIIKLTDGNYMRIVEKAIEHGLPVILENVLEEIDAPLGKNKICITYYYCYCKCEGGRVVI